MAIIIDRTITIKNDQATLDRPIYLYIEDGDITCLFTIEEKKKKAATFGSKTNDYSLPINEDTSYGQVRVYKPVPGSDATSRLVFTERAEIINDKLQVTFSSKYIDEFSEAGVHKLQIHLYDNEENRLTIPPVDLHVLMPIGTDTNTVNEAIVGYSLLDARDEEVPAFDEEGNYNMTVWETGDIITKNKLNKIEDALYEINAADSNFVTEETLDTKLAGKANTAHNHPANNITGLARVATSGSYNDLSNKPNIPNTSNLATKAELEGKAPIVHNHDGVYAPTSHTHAAYAANNHSHDGYLTEVPATYATKTYVRDYVNDSGFITSIPSSYITETELENELAAKGYASEDYVTRKISEAQLSGGGGDGSGIDLSGYATVAQLNTKADANHSHSSYLTQSSLDNYATKKYVDDAIEGIESSGGGNGSLPDMSNYPTLDVMNEALASKADNGHTHDVYSIIGHTHEDYALKSDIPNKVEVPANVGAFTNDVGYVTTTMMNASLTNKADISFVQDNYALKADIPTNYISSNTITGIEIVDELPPEDQQKQGVLYIVKA